MQHHPSMYSFNLLSSSTGKQWVALATQSVGVGPEGTLPMLARVSLIDFRGSVMVDTFVLPVAPVVRYWTENTGINQQLLSTGVARADIRAAVSEMVRGKIIVGHELWKDFAALGLTHPTLDTRDIALFLPFRKALQAGSRECIELPQFIRALMNRQIAIDNQDSLENARACMDLYRSCPRWEVSIEQDIWDCALPPPQFFGCYC